MGAQNLSLKIGGVKRRGGEDRNTNKILSKLLLQENSPLLTRQGLTRQVLLGPRAWNSFKLREKTQFEP